MDTVTNDTHNITLPMINTVEGRKHNYTQG